MKKTRTKTIAPSHYLCPGRAAEQLALGYIRLCGHVSNRLKLPHLRLLVLSGVTYTVTGRCRTVHRLRKPRRWFPFCIGCPLNIECRENGLQRGSLARWTIAHSIHLDIIHQLEKSVVRLLTRKKVASISSQVLMAEMV